MKKLLVILGPTASGKSDLAVDLAKQFNGEVISADSRQVYTHLDIATGKITKEEMCGIPHHLLDVIHPNDKEVFSVANFKEQADEAIHSIHKKNKLPILAGGTAFYIDAVVDNAILSGVPANETLRKELEQHTTTELIAKLELLDSERLQEIDTNNRVRIIRSIEIAVALGKVPKVEKNPQYDSLKIGMKISDEQLKANILNRTKSRIANGMITEAENVHTEHGVSYERMEQLGLEYKFLSHYLQKKITKQELEEKIITGDWQYAKRQMTWWKKDKDIVWVDIDDLENAEKVITDWI
jgi:tRNA dimethylallyltransferase